MQERYPAEGVHSVLLVVVDGNPAGHRNKLATIHKELFGVGKIDPLAPVQLEVIDRATDETIQRLIAAGLIAKTTRAFRPLFPMAENSEPPPLSAEERAQADAHRSHAARKLKMSNLLGAGGMDDETRVPLLGAIQELSGALAVENRLPEPTTLEDALLPPISHCWKEALSLVRAFAGEPAHDWQSVAQVLDQFLACEAISVNA